MDQRNVRLAVVAGAGRGIGRATALALARKGYRVLAGSRNSADLDTLTTQAAREGSEHALLVAQLDVRSAASVEAFFLRAYSLADGIDVLVVSAGAAYLGGVDAAPAEMVEMAMTNLVGSFQCLHFGRRLLAARKGVAVVLVSRAARACYPQSLAYGATKAGVVYLVQATARELAAQGVSVLGFSPGAVATPMRKRLFPEEDSASIVQPEETANAILALLDPSLRRATGSIIDFPW